MLKNKFEKNSSFAKIYRNPKTQDPSGESEVTNCKPKMGKKKKSQSSSSSSATDLLQTLGDFTSKENWDKFFTIRGTGDSFEWYAEWPQLRDPLISLIGAPTSSPPPQILVPGCGNSRLSEHLYDAGFHGITNVDFSKVVISDMLRRNVRDRPDMRWRVMDMTSMQVVINIFDLVFCKRCSSAFLWIMSAFDISM